MSAMERGAISFANQRCNQVCARLSKRSKRGAAVTRGDFTVAAWRKVRMLLELVAI